MHRPNAQSCLASLLAAALLVGAVGCSGENVVMTNGGGGGGDAGAGGQGGAAGVGGSVEGCIGIRVEPSVLPADRAWGEALTEVSRQPFWRDEHGLHLAWIQHEYPPGSDTWPVHLVVASFDPDTGEHLRTHVYDAFPLDVDLSIASIWYVAGAADGSFAAVITYWESGTEERVVLAKVGDPASMVLWEPPWPRAEAATFHVGYDGQAFAIHAVAQTGSQVRLVRLAPDGTVLTPETEVGTITRIDERGSSFHTDPETGTTWMATSHDDGVWLSGHYRDGTLLPGTEAEGGVDIKGQGLIGSPYGASAPAVAANGEHALLAWSLLWRIEDQTRVQRVRDSTPAADAFIIADQSFGAGGSRRVMARLGELWWMVHRDPDVGIESYELSDTQVLWSGLLVPYEACDLPCPEDRPRYLDARSVGVASWQDEVWFGYQDLSQPYPPSPSPYYVLRVKRGCSYPVHLY